MSAPLQQLADVELVCANLLGALGPIFVRVIAGASRVRAVAVCGVSGGAQMSAAFLVVMHPP